MHTIRRVENLDRESRLLRAAGLAGIAPRQRVGVAFSCPTTLRAFAQSRSTRAIYCSRIIFRQLFPVSVRVQHFQPGVAGERAEAVGQDAPAIERKAMLSCPLAGAMMQHKPPGFRTRAISRIVSQKNSVCSKVCPETRTSTLSDLQLAPMVRIAQNQIDILARRKIDADDSAMVSAQRLGDTSRCSRNCPDRRS